MSLKLNIASAKRHTGRLEGRIFVRTISLLLRQRCIHSCRVTKYDEVNAIFFKTVLENFLEVN